MDASCPSPGSENVWGHRGEGEDVLRAFLSRRACVEATGREEGFHCDDHGEEARG